MDDETKVEKGQERKPSLYQKRIDNWDNTNNHCKDEYGPLIVNNDGIWNSEFIDKWNLNEMFRDSVTLGKLFDNLDIDKPIKKNEFKKLTAAVVKFGSHQGLMSKMTTNVNNQYGCSDYYADQGSKDNINMVDYHTWAKSKKDNQKTKMVNNPDDKTVVESYIADNNNGKVEWGKTYGGFSKKTINKLLYDYLQFPLKILKSAPNRSPKKAYKKFLEFPERYEIVLNAISIWIENLYIYQMDKFNKQKDNNGIWKLIAKMNKTNKIDNSHYASRNIDFD